MISKEMKGKRFSGALSYIYEPRAKAEWIYGTTVSLSETKRLIREFESYASLRSEIDDPVFHGILSISKGEYLSNEEWKECIEYYLKNLGFNKNHPFVAVKHNDKANDHIHVVVSRIGIDGTLNRLSYSKYRGMQTCRYLEKKFNLRQLKTSTNLYGKELPFHPAERKKTTRKERGKAERINLKSDRKNHIPTREKLQNLIDEILREKPIFFDDFCLKLNEHGVAIFPWIQKEMDGKFVLRGMKYQLDGLYFKASSLGTAYKINSLMERGLLFNDSISTQGIAYHKL